MTAVRPAPLIALLLLAACGGPKAPDWMRITGEDPCAGLAEGACEGAVWFLDSANISVRGGTPYVILQSRYPDGRVGATRAECNCGRSKLEPTALKEDLRAADGSALGQRLAVISAADERAILDFACGKA